VGGLDKVAVKICGKRHWLWRAADQHEVVLANLVQEQCDQAAAEQFLHVCLTARAAHAAGVITDKLASYVPAIRRVLPTTEHRRHERLNDSCPRRDPAVFAATPQTDLDATLGFDQADVKQLAVTVSTAPPRRRRYGATQRGRSVSFMPPRPSVRWPLAVGVGRRSQLVGGRRPRSFAGVVHAGRVGLQGPATLSAGAWEGGLHDHAPARGHRRAQRRPRW
jgi:hypothetical protein